MDDLLMAIMMYVHNGYDGYGPVKDFLYNGLRGFLHP